MEYIHKNIDKLKDAMIKQLEQPICFIWGSDTYLIYYIKNDTYDIKVILDLITNAARCPHLVYLILQEDQLPDIEGLQKFLKEEVSLRVNMSGAQVWYGLNGFISYFKDVLQCGEIEGR